LITPILSYTICKMSTNSTTKKRKADSDESGISLAAVLAEMQEMKSKLSRMVELESRCISMQWMV
jgi:hypothetical protein